MPRLLAYMEVSVFIGKTHGDGFYSIFTPKSVCMGVVQPVVAHLPVSLYKNHSSFFSAAKVKKKNEKRVSLSKKWGGRG
jgi:hypothetical protein